MFELSYPKQPSLEGKYPADLYRSIPPSLYVYTDLIEPSIVGDVETPLLRIVPIDLNNYSYYRTKSVNFSPTRFLPLLRSSFQTIRIDLRDSLGNPIAFEHGRLIVTLHFKRVTRHV